MSGVTLIQRPLNKTACAQTYIVYCIIHIMHTHTHTHTHMVQNTIRTARQAASLSGWQMTNYLHTAYTGVKKLSMSM